MGDRLPAVTRGLPLQLAHLAELRRAQLHCCGEDSQEVGQKDRRQLAQRLRRRDGRATLLQVPGARRARRGYGEDLPSAGGRIRGGSSEDRADEHTDAAAGRRELKLSSAPQGLHADASRLQCVGHGAAAPCPLATSAASSTYLVPISMSVCMPSQMLKLI